MQSRATGGRAHAPVEWPCIDAEGHNVAYGRYCWRCGYVLPRKTKSRNKISKAIRAAVYHRDNFTCQACGVRPVTTSEGVEYIDLWMIGASPMRSYDGATMVMVDPHRITFLTLDHIFPYALGGLATIDNLQTLCGPCNSRKGAKV